MNKTHARSATQKSGQPQELLIVLFVGSNTDLEPFEPGPHIVVLEGFRES